MTNCRQTRSRLLQAYCTASEKLQRLQIRFPILTNGSARLKLRTMLAGAGRTEASLFAFRQQLVNRHALKCARRILRATSTLRWPCFLPPDLKESKRNERSVNLRTLICSMLRALK